jgi:hypothetical protein
MVGRYSNAHQFKRARRALKFLRTRLGRVIRDITRKIAGDAELAARFTPLLDRARRVRVQDQRQRGRNIYVLHAPEVEFIGKAASTLMWPSPSLSPTSSRPSSRFYVSGADWQCWPRPRCCPLVQ